MAGHKDVVVFDFDGTIKEDSDMFETFYKGYMLKNLVKYGVSEKYFNML